MTEIRRPGAAVLAAALALAGTTLTTLGVRQQPQPPAAPPVAVGETSLPQRSEPRRPVLPSSVLPRSVPVRLDVPAIGVHTGLVRLGLDRAGAVEVPPLTGAAPAGWYEQSPTPGEAGAAVILGHVDTRRDGPAVFYRLGSLRPGDAVTVRRTDGTTVGFRVTRVALYPKSAFPTREVYGPLDHAALRLITCGGSFDPSRGSYRSNLIVFAEV